MCTTYSVACKDCKITRDLDKFYIADLYNVRNRDEALEYRKKIEEDSFRSGLLVSFMAKHAGHDCVFVTKN